MRDVIIALDFESADEAVTGLGIGVVVEFYHRGEPCGELLVALVGNAATEFLVNGSVGQLVLPYHTVNIHASAAAEYGTVTTLKDAVVGTTEVGEELVEVVFVARIVDVD